jgi:hypothetical protein
MTEGIVRVICVRRKSLKEEAAADKIPVEKLCRFAGVNWRAELEKWHCQIQGPGKFSAVQRTQNTKKTTMTRSGKGLERVMAAMAKDS